MGLGIHAPLLLDAAIASCRKKEADGARPLLGQYGVRVRVASTVLLADCFAGRTKAGSRLCRPNNQFLYEAVVERAADVVAVFDRGDRVDDDAVVVGVEVDGTFVDDARVKHGKAA